MPDDVSIWPTKAKAELALSRAKIPAELYGHFIKQGYDGQWVAEVGKAKLHLEKVQQKPKLKLEKKNPEFRHGNFKKGRKSPWLAVKGERKKVNGETASKFICRLLNEGWDDVDIVLEARRVFDNDKITFQYPSWYRWLMRKKGTYNPKLRDDEENSNE